MERQEIRQDRLAWLRAELERAYTRACSGKSKTPGVVAFDKDKVANLDKLAIDIHARKYTPSASTAFIINNPVKREVFAADFRDRIVHHFLFNQVNQWWNARFIEDNYSCRIGKGTLYGIKRLDHHIRSVSCNYSRPAYVLS